MPRAVGSRNRRRGRQPRELDIREGEVINRDFVFYYKKISVK